MTAGRARGSPGVRWAASASRELLLLTQDQHRALITQPRGLQIGLEDFRAAERWSNPRARMLDVHLRPLGAEPWLLAVTPAQTALLAFPQPPAGMPLWKRR